MDLFSIIAVFVIVGILLYLINVYVPMEPRIKTALNVVVVVFLILWVLLGIVDLPRVRIDR